MIYHKNIIEGSMKPLPDCVLVQKSIKIIFYWGRQEHPIKSVLFVFFSVLVFKMIGNYSFRKVINSAVFSKTQKCLLLNINECSNSFQL